MIPHAGPRANDEVPMEVWKKWRQIQNWISSSSPEWNITISADHQVFTVDKDAIHGDMIRGTTYNQLRTYQDGKATPVKLPKAGSYVFRYSISSGKGDWTAAQAWRQGMAFNDALIPVVSEDELMPKSLPAEQSFLFVPGDTIAVTALKKADRGDGIVLRFFEAAGKSADTSVQFMGQQRSFRSVNMLEESAPGKDVQTLHVNPYEIETVKIPAAPKTAK
jgi:alpha-mannosidase